MAPFDATLGSILVTLVPALVVGIATAIVTVRLALSRFRQERWWERKAQGYADLFQALFNVQWHARRQIEEIEEGTRFVEGYMKELARRSSEGFAEVRKFAAIGALLFSPETSKRLSRLERALDSSRYNQDPHEETSRTLDAVTSALDELRPMAHRDLRLPAKDAA